MGKNLILYYSRRGQNYVGGSIRELEKGNSCRAAEYIRDAVGGDLFELETVKDYPVDYMACTEVAKEEQRTRARPALKAYLDSTGGYDNIFICGPCWWGTYPMAVFSQLERLDWKGRRVFPLMTHEGSGLGTCVRDLKKACAGARIGKGLAVQGGSVESAGAAIAAWAGKCVG